MKTFLINFTAEYDISEVLTEQEAIDKLTIRLKAGNFIGDDFNNININFIELLEKEL